MKAVTYDRYGPPEVLQIEELPEPSVGDNDLLVQVEAFSVTTADWRFRASAFPSGMWLIGRLMVGLFRPRQRLTSREFSGRVVDVGRKVRGFAVGDEVFGVSPNGVSAERIRVPASAPIIKKPATLTHAEAAALPFGGLTAVDFSRNYARIERGHRVLILGASGGVGVYLVQMAKHLGAEVTAVASAANHELLRSLGADRVVDYRTEDPRRLGVTFDAIIDPIGKSDFKSYRSVLSPQGRHAFIEAELREIGQAIVTPWRRGPTVVFGVTSDSVAGLRELIALVESGALRPVIGHRFRMDDIVEAHRLVDGRHKRGALIIDVGEAKKEAPAVLPRAV